MIREDVIKGLKVLRKDFSGYKPNEEMFDMAIKALEQELQKGRWTEHPHEWGDNWQYSQYECSRCHNWAYFDTDFCPNCGADMREVEG